jgi:glycosyltransferase involved in cell wall biosynthesis
MSPSSRLRILLLQLEFHHWSAARHWSYAAQLGYEEGLEAAGVEYFTLTTPWFAKAQALCGGNKFDQVWIDVGRHDLLDERFMDWVASVAPVRVGFIGESLDSVVPVSEKRISREKVEHRLGYLTHVLAVDERDAEEIHSRRSLPAMWWPQAVPSRTIIYPPPQPRMNSAVFCGGQSAIRDFFLKHPDLRGLLLQPPSPERGTIYPSLFHALHIATREFQRIKRPASPRALAGYLRTLRWIRRRCFDRWLKALQAGCAVVNLPHQLKAYPGRVVEGMAAGRPVISWDIPDRPRSRRLFEDGKEILFFSRDNPAQLAEHIQHIQREPEFARKLVESAQKKLWRSHTIEERVCQILDWIETGATPAYE